MYPEVNNKNYVSFTVCNVAYLHKALVLAKSYFRETGRFLKIYIIDTKREIEIINDNQEIIWIEDVNIPDFKQLAFKYDITELSTSLKPFLAKINLQNFDKVLFFDPDICIYASLEPILMDLDNSSILLTPHYNKPEPDDWPNSDIGMMRFGSFNLGFFGFRKTQQVENYLNWWHDRCMRFCFFETQFGLSTDQKWINIAPCFFDDIHISFNSGYNMAFWNLHERILLLDKGNNLIVNDKYPLIFFHFSSFNDNNPDDLSIRPVMAKVNINDTVRAISKQYDIEQKKFSKTISNKIYGFDYMCNGEYISPTLRRAYASILDELDDNHDPFNSESIIGNFARKNYLIEKSNKPYKTFGYTQKSEHKKKFVIIYLFLKILLRIMGPNNFTNFSRLLTYLSSYRQNRLMWKL